MTLIDDDKDKIFEYTCMAFGLRETKLRGKTLSNYYWTIQLKRLRAYHTIMRVKLLGTNDKCFIGDIPTYMLEGHSAAAFMILAIEDGTPKRFVQMRRGGSICIEPTKYGKFFRPYFELTEEEYERIALTKEVRR